MVDVRVGIPLTGGQLVAAARERGYPVLFSANAFCNSYPKGHEAHGFFRSFKLPDPEQFRGLNAALDSAGFVAAVQYGDYRWTPEAYLDLAQSFDWAWYASMDFCNEPLVAKDRPLRLLRLAATAGMLGQLNRLAAGRGMKLPMPVLQGWTADEYVTCAEWLPLLEWPDLVGIGSVCRRHLNGPDGILTIVDALDQVLPPNVKFHMFGVKSSALQTLIGHRRIASMDSMAWDFGARMERRTGRTMDFRIEQMQKWAEGQQEIVRAHETLLTTPPVAGIQRMLFDPQEFGGFDSDEEALLEALALVYADLLRGNDIEYRDAVWQAHQDAYPLIARIRQQGVLGAVRDTAEETDGFLEHAIAVAERGRPELAQRLQPLLDESDIDPGVRERRAA